MMLTIPRPKVENNIVLGLYPLLSGILTTFSDQHYPRLTTSYQVAVGLADSISDISDILDGTNIGNNRGTRRFLPTH